MQLSWAPLLLVALATTAVTSPRPIASALVAKRAPAPYSDFVNNIAFAPGPQYNGLKTFYGRSAQLSDNSILLTWENYRTEPPMINFLLYKSTDGGATWNPFSTIEDKVNGWGLRWHPFLYVLPQAFAGYKTGDLLAAGTSIPGDYSQTYIDLYGSKDGGKSWTFLSHIAYGNGPTDVREEGHSAVWEPFLVIYNNRLVCFYSDQTDPQHSQKLVHVTSTDGKTWSAPVGDVVEPNQNGRPGMTVVANIKSTGKWIMTYEDCVTNGCALTYKVSSSPLTFGSVSGTAIVSNDTNHIRPFSTSYVTWTPHPSRNDGSGLIFANGQSSNLIFVNEDTALPGGWKTVDVGQNVAYSRQLSIIRSGGKKKLFISSAGVSGGTNNMVGVGVVEVPT